MKHLNQDELVLLFYEEKDGLGAAAGHLQTCPDCRRRFQELDQTLNQVDQLSVPDPGAGFADRIWQRLSAQLLDSRAASSRRQLACGSGLAATGTGRAIRWNISAFLWPFRCLWAPGMALICGAVLLWLRISPSRDEKVLPVDLAPVVASVQTGVLLKEIGDCLDRAHSTLLTLATKTDNALDISAEQAWARELIDLNRLYCRAVPGAADRSIVNTLADLEKSLTLLSNSPARLSPAQAADLLNRMDRDLAFKVQVASCQVRAREGETARRLATTRSS